MQISTHRLTIIGTGYVGLVAGACLADHGRRVVCVDTDAAKIKKLAKGVIPFHEPGLDELVRRNVREKRLSFTTQAADAITQAQIIMLAVGTPPKGDGETDLAYVLTAARTIAENLQPHSIVIVKSTVPVGTTMRMREVIAANTDVPFHVGFNPEFLREGSAVYDFMHPNRTIVGCENEIVCDTMRRVYSSFISKHSPYISTDIASAEITKYAANAMLATRISFMNNIAAVCEKTGADVETVKKGIGYDDRIGDKFLNPGIGVGGSCFPKDLKSLIHTGMMIDEPMPILRSVLEINQRMPALFVQKIRQALADLKGRKFAVWGLSFKPDTDDMREAPSIVIINQLVQAGATISAFDPAAMKNAQAIFDTGVDYASEPYEACTAADALLVLTEWNAFRNPDWPQLRKLLKTPILFDGRNIYELAEMQHEGFSYFSVGRPAVIQPQHDVSWPGYLPVESDNVQI